MLSESENGSSVRRKWVGEGVGLAVAFLFYGLEYGSLLAGFIHAVNVV